MELLRECEGLLRTHSVVALVKLMGPPEDSPGGIQNRGTAVNRQAHKLLPVFLVSTSGSLLSW